jgi:murein DD-endopeptidase MepM/ murein hydrolase activator NlpD
MQSNPDDHTIRFLIVGGTFNAEGGRASGYIGKLSTALASALPRAKVSLVNGGTYEALAAEIEAVGAVTHLAWFADVPNDYPKLLPVLKKRYPAMVLVASKNNRKGLYTRDALYARMHAARNELLVEFADGPDGRLVASVLTAGATVALESSSSVETVATCLAREFGRFQSLVLPLAKKAYVTDDSDSFVSRDFGHETEIPVAEHVGAFGKVRRNHIHEGIDLYGQPGDLVYAMESGVVVARQPFTGVAAGSPWWADTECVLIEGASGVLNYGEIKAQGHIVPGARVTEGEAIGQLVTVLLKDKGRPRTMLHLERYVAGTSAPIREWSLNDAQPACLRDPTALLVQAAHAKAKA